MISMRYHIVSIAAVFLALALGIFLGATKVQSPILVGMQSDQSQMTEENAQLAEQNELLGAQVAADQKFAGSVGALAVRGTLPKTNVVLVTTPGADPTDRDAVLSLLSHAGATVTAQLDLTADFTDPTRAEDLQALLAKSLPAGAELPAVASTGKMAGALLGSVLVTDESGNAGAKPEEATAALSALSTGGYISATGTQTPGRLVLILTGGALSGGSETDRATVIADMAVQLRDVAGGVVIAGREGSASETGAVGMVRSDTARSGVVTTVDDVETAQGRVGTVLGLVEQNGGGVGQYGNDAGAQRPVPALAVG